MPGDNGQMLMAIQPEPAGEISAMEAAELKALDKLETQQRSDIEHQQRLLVALQNHRRNYARQIVEQHGLSLSDNYNINDDNGLITRTHRSVPIPPPEVTPEATDVPAADDAVEAEAPVALAARRTKKLD